MRLYVDAGNARQREAAEALGKSLFSAFGKIEAVKEAKIALEGSGGRYTVTVDGGRTMKFTTEPILGADKRTPIAHSNINNPLSSTMLQGKTVSATYSDENRSITLDKGTNSFFYDRVRRSGEF